MAEWKAELTVETMVANLAVLKAVNSVAHWVENSA